MKIKVPKELIGDKSTMYEAFIRCAAEYGDDKDYAIELLRLLPQPVKQTSVWLDKLTNIWRYEYGTPYDRMPEGIIISGTNVHLPTCDLYASIRIADKRLRRDQFLEFLKRLSNAAKHRDVLFEMRPMKNVKATLETNYEVLGLGIGNTTCDWQVKGRFINIAFDVKNRTKSLLEHMKQIIPHLDRGAAKGLPPAPSPENLFKSVENKFKERCYLVQLQGAWIHSDIKEHEDSLRRYFMKELNRKKVHFAILSDWKNDAFILARNRMIRIILKKTFHLTESKRFVTREYV